MSTTETEKYMSVLASRYLAINDIFKLST